MMKKATLIFFIFCYTYYSFSQVISSTQFVQASISDGEKLTKAYLMPLEHSMAFANSDGNINFTNNTNKISFNIGISISSISSNGKDNNFDVNSLGLQEVKASDPNNTIAQTFFGTAESIDMETNTTYSKPTFPFGYKQEPIARFKTTEGAEIHLLPVPIINMGVYAYGTHINFNVLAKINIPETDGDIYSVGFNIQHNLGQFIKPISNLPFDISFLIGWQKTKLNYYLDIKPDETRLELNLGDNGPYDNQVLTVETYAIPFNLIISKEIKGFNIYGFVAYSLQESNVALKGNYPLYIADPSSTIKVLVEDVTNPFKYNREFNEMKAGLGFVYQLHFMKFKTNATFSHYFLFNMGLEINF